MKQTHGELGLTIRPVLCGLLASVLLSGCADSSQQKKEAIERVGASFSASSITLRITAQPQLNEWNGLPNSCTVLVIQVANNEVLNKVINDPVQLKSLFNGAGTAEGILQVDRYTVMPGQRNVLHIDRADKTRNVAIVPGYYPFPSQTQMAHFTIPVVTRDEGWFSKQWVAELTELDVDIILGSKSLLRAQAISSDINNAGSVDSVPPSDKVK